MRSPSYWLDPRGRATYGIGICARCGAKLYLDQLSPDPNSPGLMVCDADKDVLDPYRLPARQTEQITLPFNRPDVNLTGLSLLDSPSDLSGTRDILSITLTWSSSPGADSYDVYRQAGTDPFVLIGSVDATQVLTFIDSTIDSGIGYAYYVVAVAELRGSPDQFSPPSNTVSFGPPPADVTVTIGTAHSGEFPFPGQWESGGDGWSSGDSGTTGPTGTITPPAATYLSFPILVMGDVTGFGFGSNPASPIIIIGFPQALGSGAFSKIVVTKTGGSPLTLFASDAVFQQDPIQGVVSTWSWHVDDPTLYFEDGIDTVVTIHG